MLHAVALIGAGAGAENVDVSNERDFLPEVDEMKASVRHFIFH